jgi:hypothetical protein
LDAVSPGLSLRAEDQAVLMSAQVHPKGNRNAGTWTSVRRPMGGQRAVGLGLVQDRTPSERCAASCWPGNRHAAPVG